MVGLELLTIGAREKSYGLVGEGHFDRKALASMTLNASSVCFFFSFFFSDLLVWEILKMDQINAA